MTRLAPPAEHLRRLYEDQRLITDAIGQRFGVSKRTAGRWLRSAGIQARPAARNTLRVPTHDELRLAYIDQHASVASLAAHYGTSRRTAGRWLRAAGIPARPRSPELPPDELRRLYEDEALSCQAIADRYRASVRRVRLTLRAAGVQFRSRQAGYRPKTAPDCAELHRLYVVEDRPLADIAAIYRASPTTASRWLAEAGIPARGRGGARPVPPAEELRALYVDTHETLTQIGRRYGVSYVTVSRWLKKYGIPIRPRGPKRGVSK